jgi:hypothetical protein
MLGTMGLKYWVKWKGGVVVKDEMQIFTGDFLFMINVLKPVLLKKMLESILSILHHKVFGLVLCYITLQPGFSECWYSLNE